MRRAVVISQRAADEIQEAHDWWAEHRSALQAARWYDGLLSALEGLREGAHLHSTVSNAADFPFEVRELLLVWEGVRHIARFTRFDPTRFTSSPCGMFRRRQLGWTIWSKRLAVA